MSNEERKQVGEVVETLIRIRDKFYSSLMRHEREALNDACSLLSLNLGDFTKYDYTGKVIESKRIRNGGL